VNRRTSFLKNEQQQSPSHWRKEAEAEAEAVEEEGAVAGEDAVAEEAAETVMAAPEEAVEA
jgi:hypothetical protein